MSLCILERYLFPLSHAKVTRVFELPCSAQWKPQLKVPRKTRQKCLPCRTHDRMTLCQEWNRLFRQERSAISGTKSPMPSTNQSPRYRILFPYIAVHRAAGSAKDDFAIRLNQQKRLSQSAYHWTRLPRRWRRLRSSLSPDLRAVGFVGERIRRVFRLIHKKAPGSRQRFFPPDPDNIPGGLWSHRSV